MPVVASDLPELGSARRTRTGIGWTVDPASIDELSEALRGAIAAARDRCDAARVRAAGEGFAWTRERDRLVAAYRRLAAEPDAVLVLVRNPVRHDARVLREAETLARSLASSRSSSASSRRAGSDRAPAQRGGRPACCDSQPRSPLGRCALACARGAPRSRTAPAAAGGPGAAGAAPVADPAQAPAPALRRPRTTTVAGSALVRGLRPALVHCNDHNTMWIGVARQALRAACRLVYDAHELWPDRNGRLGVAPWLLATEALFVRVADEVITTSPGYAERMARRYRIESADAWCATSRPVRRRPAHGARAEPRRSPSTSAASCRGRGLEQAIDALALAPEIRLRLIGPGRGEYQAGLRARARARGVEDRVEWRGAVTPREVVPALKGAAVGLSLIQPICESYELTLPNKLFEYLAAGIPVLTSDVPVSARFVEEHGIGEVVGADDVVGIARALERLGSREGDGRFHPQLERARTTLSWSHEKQVLVRAYGAAA